MRLILLFLILFVANSYGQHPQVSGLDRHTAEVDAAFAGEVLISELSCTACHQNESLLPKNGPVLEQVGQRIHPDYLEKFIAAPHQTKPGTTMPDMLGKLSEEQRQETARAISDYLQSTASEPFKIESTDPELVESGRELYHSIGCVACHDAENKDLPHSSELTGIETKYSLQSLTQFLEDPLAVRPAGRMPDLQLTHWEAKKLASYLLRDQKMPPVPAKSTFSNAALGKELFEKHQCNQCHDTNSKAQATALSDLPQVGQCNTADYSLSDSQQTQIAASLKAQPGKATIKHTLTQLNCIACHDRDGIGGVSQLHDEFFTTTNLNLGEQARIPPSLDGIGAKLQRTWLKKVLHSGTKSRPYMTTRMPKFGVANIDHLVDQFAAKDSLPEISINQMEGNRDAHKVGLQIAGTQGLNCVACHTFKGESGTTLNAIDLVTMASRLQEPWFHTYMRNPQEFYPSTIMPNFWPNGKAVRQNILDGDTGKQLDALWQYLEKREEARPPSGIVREPILVRPENGEAVILRRQYTGIGKRGIGVGYPSGMNLAFDAAQLRLGTVWKGEVFGEMSRVWRGQGSGMVIENTELKATFPVGPAFAKLDSISDDWPTLEIAKPAEGFQFLGYSLDKKQRPTFRYTFAGVTIEDFFEDKPGELVRTLSFDRAFPEGHFFRVTNSDLKAPDQFQMKCDAMNTNGRVELSGKKQLIIHYLF